MVMKAELTLQGCGIGLRREHYEQVLRDRPSVAWFEVISENFMVAGGRPRRVLEEVRRDYPVGVHAVSLSIGSAEPIFPAYLNTSGYLERIVEAMEQSFPALRRILGRGAFGSLVRRYLELHPPFDLGQVGRSLDSFLPGDPLSAELPFLPDLARLEWQVWESFTARDEPPLAWSDLQELGAAAAIELPLKLRPGTAVVRSPWPLVDLWGTRTLADAEVSIRVDGCPSRVLVVRGGFTVRCREIGEPDCRLAEAVSETSSLETLQEVLSGAPGLDTMGGLLECFRRLVDEGVFAAPPSGGGKQNEEEDPRENPAPSRFSLLRWPEC
jgi:hypothetical protein